MNQRPEIAFGGYGHATFLKEVVVPFSADTAEVLRQEGFADDAAPFPAPRDLFPDRSPRAALDPVTFFVALSFVGGAVGSWAIGKFCDTILDKKLAPAISKLKERWFPSAKPSVPDRPFELRLGIWYEPDQLYVNVVVKVRNAHDLEHAVKSIIDAHKAAPAYVKGHRPKDRVLTYTAVGGVVSTTPAWSHDVPS